MDISIHTMIARQLLHVGYLPHRHCWHLQFLCQLLLLQVVMYYILKMSLILTLLASLITLFLAMGFGFKLSKELEKIQQKHRNQDDNDRK